MFDCVGKSAKWMFGGLGIRPAGHASNLPHRGRRCRLATVEALEGRALLSLYSGGATVTFGDPAPSRANEVGGVGTSAFTWGTPAGPTSRASRLAFTPSTFNARLDGPAHPADVNLGSIRFSAGDTLTGTGADDVVASLVLNLDGFASPVGSIRKPKPAALKLSLVGTSGRPDADVRNTVTLPADMGPVASFRGADGVTVDVDLIGFQDATTGLVSRSLSAPDSGSETAYLLARFKARPAAYVQSLDFNGQGTLTGTGTSPAPMWLDMNGDGRADGTGERSDPLLYASNATMKISPSVVVPGLPASVKSIWVRASGPDGLDYPMIQATRAQGTDSFSTLMRPVATGFRPGTARAYDSLTLCWEFSTDRATWSPAGETHNAVYVSPMIGGGGPSSKPSALIDVARLVTLAADGVTTRDGQVAAVWSKFAGLDVRRADGTRVGYWLLNDQKTMQMPGGGLPVNGQSPTPSDTTDLCGDWAQFLGDCLGFLGINDGLDDPSADGYHIQSPTISDGTGFITGDWDFLKPGLVLDQQFPYTLISKPNGNAPYQAIDPSWTAYSTYGFWGFSADPAYATAKPGASDPAQDNAAPPRIWGGHTILRLGNTIYDPSYGIKAPSADAYQNMTMPGFIKVLLDVPIEEAKAKVDLNGDGDVSDSVVVPRVIVIRKNPTYWGMGGGGAAWDGTTVQAAPPSVKAAGTSVPDRSGGASPDLNFGIGAIQHASEFVMFGSSTILPASSAPDTPNGSDRVGDFAASLALDASRQSTIRMRANRPAQRATWPGIV